MAQENERENGGLRAPNGSGAGDRLRRLSDQPDLESRAREAGRRALRRLAEPALSPRALLVVDNVLMSGEVALRRGAPDTYWAADRLAGARILNAELLDSSAWVAAVLPIGDGIAFASRR